MAKHRLQRLPVIDQETRLVGMISLSDIANSIRLHESGPSSRQAPETGMANHTYAAGTNQNHD
jgi:CBS-domain-containing membrane protein